MHKYRQKLIFVLVLIITIALCIYALNWHQVYKDNELNKTIITEYMSEIKSAELNSYLNENPTSVIYFGITNDDACRSFENKLKNYIVEKSIKNEIVYLNVNSLVDYDLSYSLDKLYNNDTFRKKGQYFKEVPAIAIYDHTKLVAFISSKSLTIEMVDELLATYNIYGEQ